MVSVAGVVVHRALLRNLTHVIISTAVVAASTMIQSVTTLISVVSAEPKVMPVPHVRSKENDNR